MKQISPISMASNFKSFDPMSDVITWPGLSSIKLSTCMGDYGGSPPLVKI